MEGVVKQCSDLHYARLGDGVCRLCKGGYLCKGGAKAPDEGELVPVGYAHGNDNKSVLFEHLNACSRSGPIPLCSLRDTTKLIAKSGGQHCAEIRIGLGI